MMVEKKPIKELRFLVLCEDIGQQKLIRKYLEKKGVEFGEKKVYFWPLPAGAGSGELYVRDNFPALVATYRKKHRENIAVIVAMDGDLQPNPKAVLLDSLTLSGMEKRRDDERIAILVPRRNVETWLAFFRDSLAVDESVDFKSFPGRKVDVQKISNSTYEVIVNSMIDYCHFSPLPKNLPPAPPSFAEAVNEWARLAIL